MWTYFFKRLLLMIPTLFLVLTVNFFIIQIIPGGPIEEITSRLSREGEGEALSSSPLPNDYIQHLKKQYGFDQPLSTRFIRLIRSYLTFDFGKSYFQDIPVMDLIGKKLPESLGLTLISLILIYAIGIPLGISQAIRPNTSYDAGITVFVSVLHAIPTFLMGIVLLIFFAGKLDWFPLTGQNLTYKNFLWHMVLPVIALTFSGLASISLMTRNAFLDEMQKKYILAARAKGAGPRRILYGHIFRNAMLPLASHVPGHFIRLLFTGTVVVEIVFSLDGLGLLGYEAAIHRDYPVMLGLIYTYTIISMVLHLVGDFTYALIDPRVCLTFPERGHQ